MVRKKKKILGDLNWVGGGGSSMEYFIYYLFK